MLKASLKKVNSSKENSYNLLKRLISFKNKKTLSIGTSLTIRRFSAIVFYLPLHKF